MKKLLLITNKIPHYRLALYERLGQDHELTILHEGPEVQSTFFRQLIAGNKKIGPFIDIEYEIDMNQFDVVVLYANLRLLNLYKILFFSTNRKFKVILYGIGVAASYDKRYDSSGMYVWFMKHIIERADAAIFYDAYPTIRYAGAGVDPAKLFVAFNTVAGNTKPILPRADRSSILFVGSLYLQKGIQTLLEAYVLNQNKGVEMPTLDIIGGGPEKNAIEEWILRSGFEHKIKLHGPINDEPTLQRYFAKALMCVSPSQAGLSVQKAFSYGVPFVTTTYPISGGEFSSIIDGVTGYYFDGSAKGLADKMLAIVQDPNLESVFTNCREFYLRFRSPEVWRKGFATAIDYVSR